MSVTFPLFPHSREEQGQHQTHLYTLNNSLLGRLNLGKMADVPNADPVCRRHSWQWQMYKARGFSRGVLKLTAPHWHVAFILSACDCLCFVCLVMVFRRPEPRGRAARRGVGLYVTDDELSRQWTAYSIRTTTSGSKTRNEKVGWEEGGKQV